MCSTVKLPIHIKMLQNILSKKIIPFLSLFRFCQLKIADRVDKNGTYLYTEQIEQTGKTGQTEHTELTLQTGKTG